MSIFMNNETSLAESNISLDDRYMTSYGSALALIESVENQSKMFEACVRFDMREAALTESADIMALQEAGVSSIWEKIRDLFKKAKEKIASILHVIMSKFNALTMSNKAFAKKYRQEVMRKINIDNIKVSFSEDLVKYNDKLANYTEAADGKGYKAGDVLKGSALTKYNAWIAAGSTTDMPDADEIKDCVAKHLFENDVNDYDDAFDKEDISFETEQLKDCTEGFGTASKWWTELENSDKAVKELNKTAKSAIKTFERNEKEADKAAKEKAKAKPGAQDQIRIANMAYKIASLETTMVIQMFNLRKDHVAKYIAMIKAGCVKMVAASDKKLEESVVSLMAEAAYDEVSDLFTSVSHKDVFPENWGHEECGSLLPSNSKSVEFGYEDYHRIDAKNGKKEGTIGTDAYGNKHEAAMFNFDFV